MDIVRVSQLRHSAKAFDPARKLSGEQVEALKALLRNTPSSVNSQPWHFVLAGSDEGKARVARATHGSFAYNEPKVRNASHVAVLCVRNSLDDAHLGAVLAAEDQAGRFASGDAKAGQDKARRYYAGLHQNELDDETEWMTRQVYIALGALLLGAGCLGIDACPMEGFDGALLNAELGLDGQGYSAVVLVALGYRGDGDFNAALPKARLPEKAVLSLI